MLTQKHRLQIQSSKNHLPGRHAHGIPPSVSDRFICMFPPVHEGPCTIDSTSAMDFLVPRAWPALTCARIGEAEPSPMYESARLQGLR